MNFEKVSLMMKTIFFSLLLASSAVLSACGSAPVVAVVESAAPCLNCGSQPYYAYAVTRPPMCNDYPVTYRVQIPEVDERVRAVDRSALYSREGASTVYGGCPR